MVTFDNAKKLKEAVEFLPMDKILLETDSPYLTPVPNRGKRNSSLNLPYIARQLSLIHIYHKKFHDAMIQRVLEGLNEQETVVLVKTLQNLRGFFYGL